MLTMMEVFCGVASIVFGFRMFGYLGKGIDKNISMGFDFVSSIGIVNILGLACTIKRGGLVWLAPPCSSWVFMSAGI